MDKIYDNVNRFITNNESFDLLNSKLNEFNPFKIMKIDKFEIRHSNILAWLLSPSENHFLNDMVLKKIITEIICRDIDIKNHSMQVTDVLLSSFHDVEVLREWRNIDIIVISKSNEFVLFIENKVHARLESHQLEKYINLVKDNYPNIKHVIPVFLTLNGEESPHPEYYSLGYSDILRLLNSLLVLNKENMNSKIYDFISYYIRTLEVLTLEDEQLIKLCRDIYKHHGEAIETIIKYGYVSNSTLNQATEVLKPELNCIGYHEDRDFHLRDKEYWFIPKSLDSILPRLVTKWRSPRPVSYFFAAEDNSLRLILEVGPIANLHIRNAFLNYINSQDSNKMFSIRTSALNKLDGKYTRIRTKSVKVDDWTDSEHVVERMRVLLEKVFKYNEVNALLVTLLNEFELGKPNETI
ncbi:PD-(D/E)XK nuclease family protein [Priestia sp. FSL H7-0729]